MLNAAELKATIKTIKIAAIERKNGYARTGRKVASSKYRGVCKYKGGWRVQVQNPETKKRVYLGRFKRSEEDKAGKQAQEFYAQF